MDIIAAYVYPMFRTSESVKRLARPPMACSAWPQASECSEMRQTGRHTGPTVFCSTSDTTFNSGQLCYQNPNTSIATTSIHSSPLISRCPQFPYRSRYASKARQQSSSSPECSRTPRPASYRKTRIGYIRHRICGRSSAMLLAANRHREHVVLQLQLPATLKPA